MEEVEKTLLLVEDEPIIAMAQTRSLQNRGYTVITVNSGEKALEAVLDSRIDIDLVLMDIDLGKGIDGTMTAREILARRDIPIVFLSSHTEKSVVEKTESITSYGYVVKNSGIVVLDASIKMAFRLFDAKLKNGLQRMEIEANNEELRVSLEELESTIGELQQSQDALANTERRYRLLFENMTAGFALHRMIYDAGGRAVDYRFLDVNPAFEKLTGLSARSLIGKTVLEALPATERYWIDTYDEVARTGKPLSYRNFSAELGKHFDTWVFSPEKGQFAVVFTDISDKVAAETALRESNERFGTLFRTLAQGIVYQDTSGRIIDANAAAERMLGLSLDQLRGTSSVDPRWKAVHEDGSPYPGETHPAMVALATGKAVTGKIMGVFNPKLGSVSWLRVDAIPLIREGETVPHEVYAFFEDLTAWNTARDEMRKSEDRFRLTLDAIDDGIWEWNVQSGEAFFSPRYYGLLGYGDGEFPANYANWQALVHPDDLARVETDLREHVRIGRPFSIDLRMRAKDGSWRWVMTRGKAVERDAEGAAVRMMGTLSDIAERKTDEDGLSRLNERLELATKAAGMGIWDWDIQNDLLIWDDRMYELYGIGKEAFGGAYEAWFSGLHDEDREPTRAEIDAAIRGERDYDTEFRIQTPDGSVRIIKAVGRVIRDAEGTAVRMVGTNQDVTSERTLAGTRRFLSEHGWVASGVDFFEALASHLARSLGLDYVCIDRLQDDQIAVTVAVWSDGRFEDNISYALKDTPCGDVVGKSICFFPKAVRQLFPKDVALQTLEAEGYAGITLFGSGGEPIGLIALITRKPIKDPGLVEDVLKLVSIRAAGELERRSAEEELRKLVAHKEILMKETQHRVKNNLNIVSSLLEMELDKVIDDDARGVFIEAQNRIRAMSGIYERLYLSTDLVSVELHEYITDLAASIFSAYNVDPARITLSTDIADVRLDVKRSVPLGLILNELISNALKYAYPDDGKGGGEIRIGLDSAGGLVTLSVADDGVGLPAGFDPESSTSMGLMLVRMLGEELGTEVVFSGSAGTGVSLSFAL